MQGVEPKAIAESGLCQRTKSFRVLDINSGLNSNLVPCRVQILYKHVMCRGQILFISKGGVTNQMGCFEQDLLHLWHFTIFEDQYVTVQ